MSKIAIVSDSHGAIDNIALFEKRLSGVDALWHLGDHAEDAAHIAFRLNCGYVAVRGNCDPFSDAPLTYTVNWHGRRFLLLHGHTVSGRLPLLYAAKEANADAVLFGHSHVPSEETVEGVIMLNPGSLSRPRTSKGPSVALLTLTEDEMSFEMLFSETR